jgi:hypothetical protein
MRRRSLHLLLGSVAVGVPTLTWFMRRARSKKHEKRKVATNREEKVADDTVEDFTPEQTAFLRRVREIWDALGGQASADLQQTTS